jgi:hypothetical protein
MDGRAERRAMIALMAVFALLAQALFPALAAAAPTSPSGPIAICTSHGLETVDPGPVQGAVEQPCQHCVCPAAVTLPPPAVLALGSAFGFSPPPLFTAHPGPPPSARGPPRPPGQGPPLSDA